MRNLLIAALAAATLIPSAAMAAPHRVETTRTVIVDRHDDRGPGNRGPGWNRPAVVTRVVVGRPLDRSYFAKRYIVANPAYYRLGRPGINQRWVRIQNDAVLVNERTGRVIAVRERTFR
jgi:Ni/Co efflux regulator RcnB